MREVKGSLWTGMLAPKGSSMGVMGVEGVVGVGAIFPGPCVLSISRMWGEKWREVTWALSSIFVGHSDTDVTLSSTALTSQTRIVPVPSVAESPVTRYLLCQGHHARACSPI